MSSKILRGLKAFVAHYGVGALDRDNMNAIAADLLPEPGLPFPPLQIPQYKPYVGPKYTLKRIHCPVLLGYFTALHVVKHAIFVLSEKTDDGMRPWMSTETMELESHMPHISAAHGNVIVCGLGMGVALYNIASKPEVNRVWVVDNDRVVVNAFKDFSKYKSWSKELRDKIEFVHADVMTDRIDDLPTIDYMYVDVWDTLYGDGDVTITQRAYQCLKGQTPRFLGFWGQELHFASWCRANELEVDEAAWSPFCEFLGLPLMAPSNIGLDTYAALCKQAWSNIADGHFPRFG